MSWVGAHALPVMSCWNFSCVADEMGWFAAGSANAALLTRMFNVVVSSSESVADIRSGANAGERMSA